MTRSHYEDEPSVIAALEQAEDADRRADGLVPCAGPACAEWLHPGHVVIRDGADAYGSCCAVLGARVDADMVEAVCRTIFANTANGDGLGVVGRRVSVLRHVGKTWAVVYKDGTVLFVAHDVFEVARWYCFAESGEMEVGPDTPPYWLPTDAKQAARMFEERTMYMRRD